MKYLNKICEYYKKNGLKKTIKKISLEFFLLLNLDLLIKKLINYIFNDKIVTILFVMSRVPISMSISKRCEVITEAIQKLNLRKSKLKVLEIGTWCGEGYTKIIASTIPAGSDLYCLDPYTPWASDDDKNKNDVYSGLDLFTSFALIKAKNNLNKYKKLYNINTILVLTESIENFNERNFDLIVIDGDHKYKSFCRDLISAYEKLESGIIIGDDFEVSFPLKNDLIEECKLNLSKDMIFSKSISEYVHPGVVLGLYEFMENYPETQVFSKNGCFIVSK